MKGLEFLTSICIHQNPGELRQFTREYFVGDDEHSCYEYCRTHISRYGRLPEVDTLEEEVGMELPEAADSIAYYAEQLIDRKMYNDIRPHYQSLREAISDQNIEEARVSIDQLSSVSRQNRMEIDLISAGESGVAVLERYDTNHRIDGIIGVPSGWGHIDLDTAGYQGGDLIAYVARPEMGKTWLLLYQVYSANLMGYNTVVANMEMPNVAIASRFYSMVAGVDHEQQRRGRLSSFDEVRFRDAIARYANDQSLYWYQGNLGQNTSGLESVVAERRPDIVFIDGVYLMRSDRTRRNAQTNEQVRDVLDDLKTQALRRDCPYVITSQFNREGRGNKGSLENIGMSDAFSQHCSLIYAVQRPPRSARDIRTRVLRNIKTREGESGRTYGVNFKFTPTNFTACSLNSVVDQQQEDVDLDWMGS